MTNQFRRSGTIVLLQSAAMTSQLNVSSNLKDQASQAILYKMVAIVAVTKHL